MAYELDAFVAPVDTVQELATRVSGGTVVPLRDGLALLLGPEDTDLIEPDERATVLNGLTLARIEADFFGGTGLQSAWFYRDGSLVWSDVDNPTSDPQSSAWPINRALADLGHRPSRHATWNPQVLLDSFEEVGLGHCRSNAGWIRFAQEGGTGETITRVEQERTRRLVS